MSVRCRAASLFLNYPPTSYINYGKITFADTPHCVFQF